MVPEFDSHLLIVLQTKIKAADSLITRPMPKNVAVRIPENAWG